MKLIACLLMLIPNKIKHQNKHPYGYVLEKPTIGVYGDNNLKKAGELWKHERLPYYKVVLRGPYEEICVEEDGKVLLHDKYFFWGNYYKH